MMPKQLTIREDELARKAEHSSCAFRERLNYVRAASKAGWTPQLSMSGKDRKAANQAKKVSHEWSSLLVQGKGICTLSLQPARLMGRNKMFRP